MNTSDTFGQLDQIAIVGMGGRFPGGGNLDIFWRNLRNGVELISFFLDQELKSFDVNSAVLSDPNYVKAGAILENIEFFDASFFGYSPREVEIMDPQHRLFLECAWEAIENAGYDAETYKGRIGIYAGSEMSTYLLNNLNSTRGLIESIGGYQILIGNDKDYLPARVSYKLNLKGPSVTVQTACSTSLVAVHMACQSLLNGECEMALAGGVSIKVPQIAGYLYQEGGILSPDGHCKAFDAKAQGTVGGNGVGIVVLKRLEDALAHGDCIHAVIKGSAINNDGALKVGFTAPSVEGQAEVIAEAIAMARIEAETITYIEAHGTGTILGDPIEIAALTQAFQARTGAKGFCAIGSVKTNVGHLDAAAGVTGLIKTILALKHKLLPPSLHFNEPNPQIDFANSPFYVNTTLSEWQTGKTPRRAGVSSFGIGGTNAHVVLEEAPVIEASGVSRPWQLLVVSAKTSSALETMTTNLVDHLKQHPDCNLADVAYTLQVGRKTFSQRRVVICHDREDAVTALETLDPQRVFTSFQEPNERTVGFMFPGQGVQYVNMGLELYQVEPTFREQIDHCSELLKPYLGIDLRHVLYPSKEQVEATTEQLKQTWITQPALFVIEYALASLWMEWGVRPQVMIGHSLGEYVAACLANVFSLEDALALVAARGHLMQKLPAGAMLAIPLPEEQVQPLLGKQLSLAANNGPSLCVVSGPIDAVEALQDQLAGQSIDCRHLHTSHAFHSQMMDPILDSFSKQVKHVNLKPPQIPYLSNVTGTWITAAEATNADYWARQLRQTVHFEEAISNLLQESNLVVLEVGPGHTLSSLAKQHPKKTANQVILTSLRHAKDSGSDVAYLLSTLGKLWLTGTQIDWFGFYTREQRQRISLPTYPFERQRYWIESQKETIYPQIHREEFLGKKLINSQIRKEEPLDKKSDIADFFYIPSWEKVTLHVPFETSALTTKKLRWLLFLDECELGSQMVKTLQQKNQDIVIVSKGTQFNKVHERAFTINPQQPDDYNALLKELSILDKTPEMIVHLWNVTPPNDTSSKVSVLEPFLELSFYSLLFLAQALGRDNVDHPLQIAIVSNNVHQVTGNDPLCPEKAALLGPCKVMTREYPNITCCSIDVTTTESGIQKEQFIDQLITEITAKTTDSVVAYRGLDRWVQIFKPVRLHETSERTPRLRQSGVYLITGGLGGIGLALAEYLAQTVKAKLVLVGRSAFPEREEWEEWLATHEKQDDLSQKIRKVQTLEALGAEVLVISADVANYQHMQRVMHQAHARFGEIHGVIHAAGVAGGGMIQLKTPEIAASIMAPKVQGTLVLDALLRNKQLDFLVLCSSQSSILGEFGQIDYCAANAFLDAFAYFKRDTFTVSINWDAWQEAGMAFKAAQLYQREPSQKSQYQGKTVDHPLLETCIEEKPEQQTYVAKFTIGTHWVLNEHRLTGRSVIPGTAYLEMARAAFEIYAKNQAIDMGAIEIEDVFFLSPLTVHEDEEKEVRTILKRNEDGFEFTILSNSGLDQDKRPQWQQHAVGKITSARLESSPKYVIEDLQKKCVAKELVFTEEVKAQQQAKYLEFGSRWQSLKKLKIGTDQVLSILELPEIFVEDLKQFRLHPALLDVATGFTPEVKDIYLPFSYKKLKIRGSLPRKIHSYIRYSSNHRFNKETISLDISILDEQGTELVAIEEYTLRRLNDVVPSSPEITQSQSQESNSHTHLSCSEHQNLRVELSTPGTLDSLTLQPTTRQKPGPNEVEIEVITAGLNFLDVLTALGLVTDLPNGSVRLGSECAGRITTIGEGVDNFQVGDEVIAIAPGCFSTFIVASALHVVHKPAHLSFEEAATIPSAFLTAYYALHQVGRLCKDERVLIHAAAGGVGLAAVQIAQWIGAEVFATAGNPEKREFLRSLGVQYVMNSRSLTFADEVIKYTQGQGVNVVLNSLAGEFLSKSLTVLSPLGRFLEIGKRDIYQNSQLGLRPFEKGLSFFSINFDTNLPGFNSLLHEVIQYFNNGVFKPLPYRVFPITEVTSAFEYMAKAKHIGKIVLSLQDAEKLTNLASELPAKSNLQFHNTDPNPEKISSSLNLNGTLSKGLLLKEGAEAFSRIISGFWSQIVVSTRDFQAVIDQTNSLTSTTLLKKIEQAQVPAAVHPRPNLSNPYVAPTNQLEQTIAFAWQEVLGIDQVGINDNFFELGGESLQIMLLLSRLRKSLQAEIPLNTVFETPTIAGIARIVEQAKQNDAKVSSPPLVSIPRQTHQLKRSTQGELKNAQPVVEDSNSKKQEEMQFSLFFFSADESNLAVTDKYRLLFESVKFAEQKGFCAVWTPERHFHDFGGLYPNPSVISTALAMITERIQIRAGSVVLPLQNPIRVAEEWSVVDNVSKGRVALAFATGWHANDFVLMPETYSKRKETLFHGIQIIQKLWQGEAVKLPNGIGNEVEVKIFPKPLQSQLPIWLTGTSVETFTKAGEIGANVLAAFLDIDDLAEKIALYRKTLAKHGYKPEQGHVTFMLHTFIEDDKDVVREKARLAFLDYIRTNLGLQKSHAKGIGIEVNSGEYTEDDINALISNSFELMSSKYGLIGNTSSCLETVNRLRAIGVDEIACLIDFVADFDVAIASLQKLSVLKDMCNAVSIQK